MGSPILESAKVPVVSEKDKVIDEPVMVNNKEYRIHMRFNGKSSCNYFCR